MAKWKVLEVKQRGIVSHPTDFRMTGQPTILLVRFKGPLGEREVHFAPTVDQEGIKRTLDSMAAAGPARVVEGPPADDLIGMEG